MSSRADPHDGQPPAPTGATEELCLECKRLRELVAVAESAIEALRARCEDVEEDKAHLGRLCVASVQLHELGGGESDCLRNLQDLLVNLIGSEQIAIWSMTPDGRRLELRASHGIDAEPWRTLTVGEGTVGQAAATGEIGPVDADRPGQPRVCIPLLLGRRVAGVVAIFGLLPHRSGLTPRDQDVFRLISQQAAFALCCTGGPWSGRRAGG